VTVILASRLRPMLPALLAAVMALAGCAELEQLAPTPVPVAPGAEGERASVIRVIDGDTIDVRLGGETYRVRYIGIDTPERDEQCYSEATAANTALVQGQTVARECLMSRVHEIFQVSRVSRKLALEELAAIPGEDK
ncbi:MAG: hypothetical protein AAGU78_17610, partial [Chloroflexota bacterium]